jgi:two-component system, chemotaxis family, sensor kinase Cph1
MIGTKLGNLNIDLTSLKQLSIKALTEIQSHGVLLVLQEPELTILQVSNNTVRVLGIAPKQLLNQPLAKIIDSFQVQQFQQELQEKNLGRSNPSKVHVRRPRGDQRAFDAIFHHSLDGFLILELEPTAANENIPFLSFYHLAKASLNQLTATADLPAFARLVVAQVRQITEFDRVMLYKFDDDGHGEVIAEDKIVEMESYLGLHFPSSDIPLAARQTFLANRIRVIPDIHDQAVEMLPAHNPLTELPTDLTLSILRSTDACHTEYLQNMGLGASLTISLIKDGQLWGLIACHHRTPKLLPYELRQACEFLGQVIFAQISIGEDIADYSYRAKLAHLRSIGIERMSQFSTRTATPMASFVDGLMGASPNLLDLFDACGAAICVGGQWTAIGRIPPAAALDDLVQWLAANVTDEVFTTDSLSLLNPAAEEFKDVASGLLAISLVPNSYILCFRHEVIQTVNWSGDPHHAYQIVTDADGQVRLCPRTSFALWKEIVRGHSRPWQAVEVFAATALRKSIVNLVLRQAAELAIVATDLERSNTELQQFARVASHDLQAPLHQVASYVRILETRYGEKLDQDAHEFIGFALEGVKLMQTLIDDVLAYSQVSSKNTELQPIEAGKVLSRALIHLHGLISETSAIVTVGPMPRVVGDSTQLTQLFQNLIENAIKFRQPGVVPRIQITATQQQDGWLFAVRGNGIGIDPRFFERIFMIFQRLHTRDEYPGSGVGLTICKKIVERHHGRIWVTSALGQGATFSFTIPNPEYQKTNV